MMREASSVRLIWSLSCAPSSGGTGALPRGDLPLSLDLAALIQLGLVVGLFLFESFFGTCFDLDSGCGDGLEPVFTAGDLFRQADAIGYLLIVRGFSPLHELPDFACQLFFQFPDVPIT